MVQPTLSLTFNDLVTRTAEHLGVAYYGSGANEVAQNPTDVHDLDMVKRIVNDGWRRFVNSNRRWNWMTPTFTVTLDPDATAGSGVVSDATSDVPSAARYYLPDGFYGQMISWFTYPSDGPRISIENSSEDVIRSLYSGASTTSGDPYVCAIRPLSEENATSASQINRKWEVIFFPQPGTAYTLTARCRIYPNQMVEDNDYHQAGFQHDEAVLWSCRVEAESQRNNRITASTAEAWQMAMQTSMQSDALSSPRRLGYNADISEEYGSGRRQSRWYTGADSYVSGSAGTVTF